MPFFYASRIFYAGKPRLLPKSCSNRVHFVANLQHILMGSINTRADLESVLVVKSSNGGGVIAIKVSGCVPERFFFARRFWLPQVVKGGNFLGAVSRCLTPIVFPKKISVHFTLDNLW